MIKKTNGKYRYEKLDWKNLMKKINYKKQYFYQQDKKKEIYIDNNNRSKLTFISQKPIY